VTDKIRGHGKAGEEPITVGLGLPTGAVGCGVRQNLSIRLPHVSNGRDTAQWIWRGVAGCWPTCGTDPAAFPERVWTRWHKSKMGDYRSPGSVPVG